MHRALSRVAVALDTSDWSLFEVWCDRFGSEVGVLKVGLEAFLRWGSRAVERARQTPASIFLDLKLHDIPQTVAGATTAIRDLGVSYLTVHASGGESMLRAAVDAAGEQTRVLAVTVLTHLRHEDLQKLDLPGTAEGRVSHWAAFAHRAGVAGVVCSPREAGELRKQLPRPFELVTPGIRPKGGALDDQARVTTAAEAVAAGSDLLVIGRPLTRAADPAKALFELAQELEQVAPEVLP